jgi:signal transduction histidine kinase
LTQGFALGLLLGAAGGAAAATWAMGRRRKILGRFVSFAAHEINTPITAVNMTVLNLLSGVFGTLPAEQQPWVEMMREQIGRLNAIIGELRDLIHLELNKELLLRTETLSVSELAEAAAAGVRDGLAQAKVPLKVSAIPPDLWVAGDPDRTARTLTSLLFHARKFRAGGPIRLEVSARLPSVEFVVGFEGPILPPGEAERSLGMFYPALSLKQTLTATGIGLGVLRALLRLQGGELALRVEGRAHRLVMTLPAAAAPGK